MLQATEGQFNPSFHFLGLIQKALSDGIPRRCAMPDSPEVYLVPAEKAYYTAASDVRALRGLCLAAPFDLTVEPVPNWRPDGGKEPVQAGRLWLRKPKAEAAPSLAARPIQELLWYASLCASRGQLLQGCRADQPVRLKRCPDFSTLPHGEHDLTLAVSMMAESADLFAVAEATGTPLPKVFDFYNACTMLGLIEHGNAFAPQDYLAGLIQRAMGDRQMRRCELPGREPLFLAPAEGKFYTHGDAATVAAYAAASLLDMDVALADSLGASGPEEEELVQIGRMWVRRKKESQAAATPPAYPLAGLLFRSMLDASRGRLMTGSALNNPVRLTRWPEAACLELDRRFFALAAFMSANTASVARIAEHTRIPQSRVVEFHNACAALGLIEVGGSENIKARPVAEGQREIFRKISKALDAKKAGAQHEPVR
jgi:hypothetical protein